MARQIVTTRVTEAQAAVLRGYAERNGMTFYRATAHALERGIAAMVGEPELAGSDVPRPQSEDLEHAVGMVQAHVERNERFARQALYAAGAAYAAIVAVAKSSLSPDEARAFDAKVSDEAARIFERQSAKALEG